MSFPLHTPQNRLNILQSTPGLSWQGCVVVPKLDESIVNLEAVVVSDATETFPSCDEQNPQYFKHKDAISLLLHIGPKY